MKQLFVTIFVALTLSCGLHAQAVYRGVVTDQSNGKLLDALSVSLLAADSSIVSYAYTDERGRFEVSSKSRGEFLSFSFIGYKRLILPVTQFRNGQNIGMEESIVQIREVKVTSQRIRQRNDTLTYTVSGFKMPQDRSIEDVLKKIPGIEVTPNGTIKFQDKPISKFYIGFTE